jgi:hypothetical protein
MRLDGASRYLRFLRNYRRELIDGVAHKAALVEVHSPYHARPRRDDLRRVDAAAHFGQKCLGIRVRTALLLTVE